MKWKLLKIIEEIMINFLLFLGVFLRKFELLKMTYVVMKSLWESHVHYQCIRIYYSYTLSSHLYGGHFQKLASVDTDSDTTSLHLSSLKLHKLFVLIWYFEKSTISTYSLLAININNTFSQIFILITANYQDYWKYELEITTKFISITLRHKATTSTRWHQLLTIFCLCVTSLENGRSTLPHIDCASYILYIRVYYTQLIYIGCSAEQRLPSYRQQLTI